MDLKIKGQLFIVGGATAGLGRAVTERLMEEGARIIAVARREEELRRLEAKFPGEIETIIGDVSQDGTLDLILEKVGKRRLSGAFINSGGPPAKTIAETGMQDWDDGYRQIVRWKISLAKRLLPGMMNNNYGRILFSESSSVKQPVENLVLSNSLRLAIVGFSKSLAQEYAHAGITSNVIAPGYHETDAVNRLYKKKSEQEGITLEKARQQLASRIPSGTPGQAYDFASLAVWLLSPLSVFVTGQVYALDGGAIKGTM